MSRDVRDLRRWRRPWLLLLALAGPPVLAVAHIVVYVAHRAKVGTVPAELPVEFFSLLLLSAGLLVLLYRRGSPWWLMLVGSAVTVASLAAAPALALFVIVVMSAP